ncbi:MAG TPA: type IV toxin-antitoxin system AbiEi family antitoxin domain-containing protein [Solirubrobacterales bacterium]|nr:type IV toxin-antitoxin system AbiEi family antitoxin domain-containing protein [Solirubrobacterales bacterium]
MRSHAGLADLAERQYGLVTAGQLRRLGFSSSAIGRACAARRLHRVHQGIYAVGHAVLSPHARCLAATLACGNGAVLSHESAAWLWGLRANCAATVAITVASRGHSRKGMRVHYVSGLDERERANFERIPVTSVARTLLDLAARASARATRGAGWELERAIERAERLGQLDLDDVDEMLARRRGRRGTRVLREGLTIYRDPAFSRSRAELAFLDLVRGAGLTRPALNTFVAGMEIDAYWEAERFAVEIDGWEAHRTRAAFERDPVRQEDLKLAGIDSIRITARRIEREPKQVAKRLRTLLAARRRELSANP